MECELVGLIDSALGPGAVVERVIYNIRISIIEERGPVAL
jgi:hypothetical protein